MSFQDVFAFSGECEIDMKWYYIAGNGPIHEAGRKWFCWRDDYFEMRVYMGDDAL